MRNLAEQFKKFNKPNVNGHFSNISYQSFSSKFQTLIIFKLGERPP